MKYSKVLSQKAREQILKNVDSELIAGSSYYKLKEKGKSAIKLNDPMGALFEDEDDFIKFSKENELDILHLVDDNRRFLFGDINGGFVFDKYKYSIVANGEEYKSNVNKIIKSIGLNDTVGDNPVRFSKKDFRNIKESVYEYAIDRIAESYKTTKDMVFVRV